MSVLFYTGSVDGCTIQLLDAMLSVVDEKKLHLTNSQTVFAATLSDSRFEAPIVVVQVASMDDMDQVFHIKEYLDGLFLIIISGSRSSEMVAQCRQLYPRLLSFNDENPGLIAAIIEKRLARQKL